MNRQRRAVGSRAAGAPLALPPAADADRLWLGLHVVIFNLGTVLLEPAIDRHLPAPFRTPAMLERWNRASTRQFIEGAVTPAPPGEQAGSGRSRARRRGSRTT